jgi:hypothetical protein
MFGVRSATRANLPSWYAFSLVSPPPPKTAAASRPYARWIRRISVAIRSSAASQETGSNGASRRVRIRGTVSRSGVSSRSPAVHPF